MPTGYTAGVQDGSVTDFKDFLFQSARAFGALVTLRDEPLSPDIPDQFEAHTKWYDDRYDHAEAHLKEVEAMSDTEVEAAAKAASDAEWVRYQERQHLKFLHRQRYEAMLDKVHAWVPPSPDHDELKNFMIQQLTESINWDCRDYEFEEPKQLTAAEWRAEEIANAKRQMEYSLQERDKEIERTRGRNKWIHQLKASV